MDIADKKSHFLFYDVYLYQNEKELNEILKMINTDYIFRIHKIINFDIGRSSFYKEIAINKSEITES